MIKLFLATLLFPILAVGQVLPDNSPTPVPNPSTETPNAAASPPGISNESVIDQIERLLQERENAEAAAQAQLAPDKPRTHRFTNQPISRVLRVLAEEAGINYIEPSIPVDERISLSLSNLTPLQAFYDVAQSRGFQVLTDGQRYTLRRSDIDSPSFYVTKRYPIHNQPAEFLLETVANYLGVKINQVGEHTPIYPKPENTTTVTPDALGISSGTDQSRPRYEPGSPFDAPLSVGGYAKNNQNAVFLERSSNSLIVRAIPDDQEMIATEIKRLDQRERQILIKTYVVEITDTGGIGGGVDWSQTLGLNPDQGAKFSLTGQAGIPAAASNLSTVTGALIKGGGGFFSSGLVLNLSDVQITLRGLAERGLLRSNNSPMTVAKSGMPVTIRSDTKQTIFLQTPGTQVYGPSTTPYTFTTGLTIDIVARILQGGLIDLNLNPTLSTVAGTSTAQPGTSTQIPIISTRSTTANVTVRSGQAAVIGGILQDSDTLTSNGVPGLSRIPIIGYAFKTHTRQTQRTNLIVIVSPTIVDAANQRYDRLGASERDKLSDSYDLPGEPPPIPVSGSGKSVQAKSRRNRN
jgi:type II secretory pathway component GspD/PulD (secretin)